MPGIKGMKWGERNYQTEDGTWTPEGLARRREREAPQKRERRAQQKTSNILDRLRRDDYLHSQAYIKTLSDEQIRAANNRFKLEEEYRSHIGDSKLTKIKKWVRGYAGKSLGSVGKVVANDLANGKKIDAERLERIVSEQALLALANTAENDLKKKSN